MFLYFYLYEVKLPNILTITNFKVMLWQLYYYYIYIHSHFQSSEVAFRIVQVAGWKLCHSQFGNQILLSVQDSAHCNIFKLQQVQGYLKNTVHRHSVKKNCHLLFSLSVSSCKVSHSSALIVHRQRETQNLFRFTICLFCHPQKKY